MLQKQSVMHFLHVCIYPVKNMTHDPEIINDYDASSGINDYKDHNIFQCTVVEHDVQIFSYEWFCHRNTSYYKVWTAEYAAQSTF